MLSLSLSLALHRRGDLSAERTRKFHLLCKVSMTNASVSGLLPLLFYSLHTGRCNLWISSRDLGVRISTRSVEISLRQYDRLSGRNVTGYFPEFFRMD